MQRHRRVRSDDGAARRVKLRGDSSKRPAPIFGAGLCCFVICALSVFPYFFIVSRPIRMLSMLCIEAESPGAGATASVNLITVSAPGLPVTM